MWGSTRVSNLSNINREFVVFFGGVLFAETVAIIVLRASIRGTIPLKTKSVCVQQSPAVHNSLVRGPALSLAPTESY